MTTIENLSRRELAVLALVADDKSNKQIAHALALSEHTIKIHVHNIIRILGVQTRTGAAVMFVRTSAAGLPILEAGERPAQ